MKPEIVTETNGIEVVPFWNWKNVPVNVYEKFTELSKSKYGNSYWATLMSLMQKAEMFDLMANKINMLEEQIAYLLERIQQLDKKEDKKDTFR